MQHRHLNHQRFTLAAIDDMRGKWHDWADLRQAVLRAPMLLQKIERVCQAHLHVPYAQRYHFWITLCQTTPKNCL